MLEKADRRLRTIQCTSRNVFGDTAEKAHFKAEGASGGGGGEGRGGRENHLLGSVHEKTLEEVPAPLDGVLDGIREVLQRAQPRRAGALDEPAPVKVVRASSKLPSVRTHSSRLHTRKRTAQQCWILERPSAEFPFSIRFRLNQIKSNVNRFFSKNERLKRTERIKSNECIVQSQNESKKSQDSTRN